MTDAVGWRAKMGVVIPSTNTVVEHDYYAVAPPGVTFHFGRMFIEDPAANSNSAFERLIAQIRSATEIAVRDVLTAKPDYMVMGMSAETFWGGADGNAAFTRRVEELSHLKVFTGAEACRAGCAQLGVRRIAVLTPYQPVADEQVERFFSDVGLDVVRVRGLRCPSATAIAEVDERELLGALRELDADDADAIVQVGTNLSMLRLADEAERWLGKPVIAVNAATLWHAMRSAGIADRLHGFGALLREH